MFLPDSSRSLLGLQVPLNTQKKTRFLCRGWFHRESNPGPPDGRPIPYPPYHRQGGEGEEREAEAEEGQNNLEMRKKTFYSRMHPEGQVRFRDLEEDKDDDDRDRC